MHNVHAKNIGHIKYGPIGQPYTDVAAVLTPILNQERYFTSELTCSYVSGVRITDRQCCHYLFDDGGHKAAAHHVGGGIAQVFAAERVLLLDVDVTHRQHRRRDGELNASLTHQIDALDGARDDTLVLAGVHRLRAVYHALHPWD